MGGDAPASIGQRGGVLLTTPQLRGQSPPQGSTQPKMSSAPSSSLSICRYKRTAARPSLRTRSPNLESSGPGNQTTSTAATGPHRPGLDQSLPASLAVAPILHSHPSPPQPGTSLPPAALPPAGAPLESALCSALQLVHSPTCLLVSPTQWLGTACLARAQSHSE